ncbi:MULTISPECIES: DUF1648 domain-containing protein [unclassified Rhodococcus (in: high G+C Gram-positive bacteria)]|uniref:DUF1648 domain-containing protein n=1 Tax=unclassified Rhodococcus (in: high G+C Gram-positive bacteria) TaxID=192944 RepID=UPI001639FA98|nr:MULTISPECIES: DUF1648 domain-containing protein [unclassified Rhodococcus (in: high G+C Gram-positive bacteria)]MBC2641041.1 DUF1648 domain-containing protein [Rhodococcus sp. 3A]MBC2894214.1 DUF1648 domain-containing protein [Rhodococcus sp. 4CII]
MNSSRVVDPAGAVFGLLLPIVAALSGVVLTTIWEPRLPAEIATHWTTTSPDGFATPMSSAWTFTLVTVLFGGGCAAIAALAQAMLMMRRTMLVVGLSVVGLILTVQVAMLYVQLDVTDPSDTELPLWSLGLGVVIGAVVGLIGAALLRDFRTRVAATDPPDSRLPRASDPSVVADSVGFGTVGSLVLLLLFGGVPAVAVCLLTGGWWPVAVCVPLGLLVVSLLRFRVIVDESGIRVVNMGMTALRYGVEEIEGARVDLIKPFDDFGGWGLKVKGRRNYGVVTKTGPAVIVTTACGDRLTVTSPRAEEMAGALNTFADRRLRRP